MTQEPGMPSSTDSTLNNLAAITEAPLKEDAALRVLAEHDANLIHRALANPFRRKVLSWLKTPQQYFVQGQFDWHRGVPANAIHALSGLSQSTVSAHVAALVDAQLLTSTRVGQWVFLARNEDVIRAFAAQISVHL